MTRLTRRKDEYECRFLGGCPVEAWMEMHTGVNADGDECDDCPFMTLINKLAEYEDLAERYSDDGR